jgi:hypothetical protein
VTQFDRYLLPFEFLDALQGIWQDGNLRPNAFIFLRRDGNGKLSGMEGSQLEKGEDIIAMNAALAAITERSLGSPESVPSSVRAAITMATGGDFGLPAKENR